MTERCRPLPDRVADLVFYGPLGLMLEHRKLLPQLARRGRRQVAFTRTIGRFSVQQVRTRLEERVTGLVSLVQSAPVAASTEEPTPEPAEPEAEATVPVEAPSSADLSIPQYDSLSAIQVVPRLDGLDPAELRRIHDYESATRGRRTILAKIAQIDEAAHR